MAMYFSSNSLSHNDAVLGARKALNPYKLQGPTAKVTPNGTHDGNENCVVAMQALLQGNPQPSNPLHKITILNPSPLCTNFDVITGTSATDSYSLFCLKIESLPLLKISLTLTLMTDSNCSSKEKNFK